MDRHWHMSVENLLFYAVSTAVLFHLLRFTSGKIATAPGLIGDVGKAGGALFTFGGSS